MVWYWLKLAVEAEFEVGKLARLYGWPSRHLSREWRSAFLGSAGHWLHEVRLILAAYRLWEGKHAAEVAAEIQYADVHQLYRAFHRFFGTTTAEFIGKVGGLSWLACAKCYISRSKCHTGPETSAASSLDQASPSVQPKLCRREEEILTLVAQGKVNKEIAEVTGLTENTVRYYLKRARSKAKAHTSIEAAARYGFIRSRAKQSPPSNDQHHEWIERSTSSQAPRGTTHNGGFRPACHFA